MMTIERVAADAALVLSSSPELALLTKVTLLLSIGLVAARLLRGTRAAIPHLVLASTLATAGTLPLASAVLPQLPVPVSVREGVDQVSRPAEGAAVPVTIGIAEGSGRRGGVASGMTVSMSDALRFVWAIGTAAVLAMLAVSMVRLRRMRREAIPAIELSPLLESLGREAGVRRQIGLVTHERVTTPLTCGVRHATVLLPDEAAGWLRTDLERALVHEIEHVRRGDWAVQLMARVVCAVFWFHPLAWMAWRQLRLQAERACDDAVLRRSDSADYAEQLVGLARRLSGTDSSLSLAMAARSDLSHRVRSLLDPRQRRGRAGRRAAAAVVAASLALIASLAPLQAVAEDTEQDRTRPQTTSLYRAASRGDIARVTELIDQGANVNETIEGDGSPLIGAARSGHLGAVRLLLDRGADPNLAVEGDGNPLIMAARDGHVDVVRLLLERGASIDQVVPGDENALIQASAGGRTAVVRLLLERGANPNIRVWVEGTPGRQGEWRTALSQATRAGHTQVVRMLIEAGARE